MTEAPSFAAALLALQADLPRIPRTAQGQAGTRQYKYPPYDAILRRVRPVLAKHGFLWNTMPLLVGINRERFVLQYTLTHLGTGDSRVGDYPLTEGAPQQQGAAISYAKRYALVAVLDLEVVGEDDDMRERTPAKVTGPEHERTRYGLVEPTPDDRPAERGPVDNSEDKWIDQPPGNFDIGTPEDRPGSIRKPEQMRALQAAFRNAGITDRAVRLGITSDIIGRTILTADQLSQIEADHVIKELKRRHAEQEAGA